MGQPPGLDDLLARARDTSLDRDTRLAAWRAYEVEREYLLHTQHGFTLDQIPIEYRELVYQLISERTSLARKD